MESVPDSLPFHKILVPLDQSANGKRAFDYALSMAKIAKSQVIMLSVMEEIPVTPEMYVSIQELEKSIEDDLKRYVSELASKAEGQYGIKPTSIVRKGHPVRVILDVAESEQADLIVMGSRGLGTFKEILLGSISHGVISHSTVPVLIVK